MHRSPSFVGRRGPVLRRDVLRAFRMLRPNRRCHSRRSRLWKSWLGRAAGPCEHADRHDASLRNARHLHLAPEQAAGPAVGLIARYRAAVRTPPTIWFSIVKSTLSSGTAMRSMRRSVGQKATPLTESKIQFVRQIQGITVEVTRPVRELTRHASPVRGPQGLTCDGATMWLTSAANGRLYAIDPQAWRIRREFVPPSESLGRIPVRIFG